MTDELPRTPEGDLIRRARERAVPKLSIRAASARIGISPEHWGNIERGYRSVGADEPPRRLDTSPALIAKMAIAVGLTAGQIENEGQRPDAAKEMREIVRDGVPVTPPSPARPAHREVDFGGATDRDREALRPYVQEILRAAYGILGVADRFPPDDLPDPSEFPNGESAVSSIPGELLFPDSPNDASTWDNPRLSLRQKLDVIGQGHRFAAEADERERRRTGLAVNYPVTGPVPLLVSVAARAGGASH